MRVCCGTRLGSGRGSCPVRVSCTVTAIEATRDALGDHSAVQRLDRSVGVSVCDGLELLDLGLRDRHRLLHDEPRDRLRTRRRCEGALVRVEGAIVWQCIKNAEAAGPVCLLALFSRHGIPELVEECIVRAKFEHHPDDCKTVRIGGVDEVHFHFGVHAYQRVLAGGMEVPLLEFVPHLVVIEPVATFRGDLDGVPVVQDFKFLGVLVGKPKFLQPFSLQQFCRRNVDRRLSAAV